MTIAHIDWLPRLTSRLYTQFRDKPNIAALVAAKAAQSQLIEDTLAQLATLPSINASVGVQLDVIGRIVGQARLGADDPTYRLYLKGKIVALRSNGVPEAVYRVFRGLEGGAAAVVYWWGGVCQAVYTWSDVITHPCSDVALTLIRMATLGGVKVWLEWQESATAACITFDDDTDHSDGLGFCSDDELDGGVLADAAALE